MAYNQEAFAKFISDIKNGTLKTTKLECSLMGLDNNDVKCLIEALASNELLRSSLESIDLSHNEISMLPDLSSCENLQHLDLSYNNLEEYQAPALPKLKKLDLKNNKLKQNPDISACINLNTLSIESNSMQVLALTPGYDKLPNLWYKSGNLFSSEQIALMDSFRKPYQPKLAPGADWTLALQKKSKAEPVKAAQSTAVAEQESKPKEKSSVSL